MKLILKIICLKLAVSVYCSKLGEKFYYNLSITEFSDILYNWLTGKRPEA